LCGAQVWGWQYPTLSGGWVNFHVYANYQNGSKKGSRKKRTKNMCKAGMTKLTALAKPVSDVVVHINWLKKFFVSMWNASLNW